MTRRTAVFLALAVAVAGACNDDTKSSVETVVDDLRPGDCFDGIPPVPGESGQEAPTALVVAAVPCSQTHEQEVFAVFDHPAPPDTPFPGQTELTKVAQDGCAERLEGYVGRSFERSELQVAILAPGAVDWDEDDRTILCSLGGDEPLKGSQKADGD